MQPGAALHMYKHGDALTDSDSAMVKRATAEVLYVHADRLKAANVTERRVKQKARQLCCEHVFKTAASKNEHRPRITLPLKLPEVSLSLMPP